MQKKVWQSKKKETGSKNLKEAKKEEEETKIKEINNKEAEEEAKNTKKKLIKKPTSQRTVQVWRRLTGMNWI